MKPVQIPIVVGQLPRTGRPIAVGFIRAKDLIPRARIAHREFEGGTGYQRLPSPARVNSLARDLQQQKVDLPTALLLNLRDFDETANITQSEGTTFLSLSDESLWEVDGQHRCQGLKTALEDDPDRFSDYTIPFVLGLGWPDDYEMEQFYVVNSNAKSVPTTIAYDILASMGQSIPGLMQDLEESGRGWQVHGHDLAREMAETSQIWAGRIRFSNQPKGKTTVASSGLRQFVEACAWITLLWATYSGCPSEGIGCILGSPADNAGQRHLTNPKITSFRRVSVCKSCTVFSTMCLS